MICCCMAHIFEGDFSVLESGERKARLPAKEILNRCGLKPGDTIIDFGCGIGYFSLPAAEMVGECGKVLAIDISDRMLGELERRAKGVTNIELIQSDRIEGVKGDKILLINLLHEVDNPQEFLKNCINSLHPGGSVVVIDWHKREMDIGPPMDHRLAMEEVIAMASQAPIEHEIHDALYFLEFGN